MAFDHAPQVSITHGLIVFGSSSDHKVYALDLGDGRERWTFFTEGPVRFAPAISGARVLVASDDGRLYCLSVENGRLLWRFRGGPRDERLMGNEQMVSRWPARAGVLVDGDVAYFTAGMWQTDGVYLYALRVADGSVVWRNDTSYNLYMGLPHSSMEGIAAVAPQGHMALCGDTLVVPCGRAMPAGFDRHTGQLLFCDNGSDKLHHAGGSWVFVAGGMIWGRRRPVQGHPHVKLEEAEPPVGSGLIAWDAHTGKQRLALAGRLRAAVRGNILYASGDGELVALDMDVLKRRAEEYYGSGKADPALPKSHLGPGMYWHGAGYPWGPWKVAPISDEPAATWRSAIGRTYELVLAGNTLVAGGKGSVSAFSVADGERLWQASIDGDARGLAVADNRLIVSSTTGEILCFGPERSEQMIAHTPGRAEATVSLDVREQAARVLGIVGVKSGHALLLGAGAGQFTGELVRQSALTVICLEPDPDTVASARKALDSAGFYGVRAVVHQADPGRLPYADYFANLVIVRLAPPDEVNRYSAAELYRVLRPCGGVLCLTLQAESDPAAIRAWLAGGGVPESEIEVGARHVRVVRGALPGAAEWTHQYVDASRAAGSADTHVRLPLKMLWFGEPGPARAVSRHWRMPAPLFVEGRMFVSGEHHLIAMDAYNGREIWCREMPGVGRFPSRYRGGGIAADRHAVYAALGTECVRLDAATGEVMHTYGVPPQLLGNGILENPIQTALDAGGRKARPTPNAVVWEYLAVTDELLVGSVGQPNFAWTGWPEAHPECTALFALEKATGKLVWTYEAAQSVSPNAVCIKDGRAYLIDQAGRAAIERAKLRGGTVEPGAVLKALELTTGKLIWETGEQLKARFLWMGDGVLLVTKGKASAYAAADGKLLWSQPIRGHAYPVIVGDTFYLGAGAYDLRTGKARRRIDPLTGGEVPWRLDYKAGCGSFSGCPGALFCRSGAAGIVDLAGDSGMSWLGQVRPSCWVNMIAAGGMLLAPEGSSSCSCPYNYQTSLAMVPDSRHEQWSVFPQTGSPAGSRIRSLAVNLGAPGDKRDDRGVLWAAFPRPFKPGALTVPLFAMNIPEYDRRNADETPIAGTSAPWLYTSACRGLRRAELDLFLDEPAPVPPCVTPPAIDGALDDACWDEGSVLVLTDDNQSTDLSAAAWLRHDADNLYVGFRRQAARRNGVAVPWKAQTQGTDTRPWDDDSFGVRLWDAGKRTGVYLHISNTGATFDGRTDSTMYILIGSDASWNGRWHKAVRTDPEQWSAELAVPWKTLQEAGLRRGSLSVYLESVNHTGVGPERLQYRYRTLRRLYLFKRMTPVAYRALPARPTRVYDVILHFAELDAVDPGQRVFDIKLQGRTVIAGLDVVKEAGGRNRALTKTVVGVEAADKLVLELTPRSGLPPTISALELRYDDAQAQALIRAEAEKGLVASWRFDGQHPTVAKDDSAASLDAKVLGATRGQGIRGGALLFDGKDDSVNCGNDARLNITDEFTVSAWINVQSYHEDLYHDIVLSKGLDAYTVYLHRKGGGQIGGYVRIGGEHRALPIHMPDFNEWHHIAMTIRDGEQRTYYDGKPQTTSTCSGPIGSTDRSLLLGSSEAFPSQGFFHGMLDEVRIYNAVLSAEAISMLYDESAVRGGP